MRPAPRGLLVGGGAREYRSEPADERVPLAAATPTTVRWSFPPVGVVAASRGGAHRRTSVMSIAARAAA